SAKVALARGKLALAAERLARPTPANTSANLIGEREFVWAKLHAARGHQAEALAAAGRARQAFEKDGPGSARALAELEAWLRERE
ncbi:MAG TPA: hypothetical protein VK034_06190, partial [Enhygromyxa sp.]|nr:hypothetical protein [Enhygromyxa sp.]